MEWPAHLQLVGVGVCQIMSEKGIYRGELSELSSSSMVVYHTHKWNVPNSQESPSLCRAEGLLEIRAGNNP